MPKPVNKARWTGSLAKANSRRLERPDVAASPGAGPSAQIELGVDGEWGRGLRRMQTRAGGRRDGRETQDTEINEELDEPRRSKRARPEPATDQQKTIDTLQWRLKQAEEELSKTQKQLNITKYELSSTTSALNRYTTHYYNAQRACKRRDDTIGGLRGLNRDLLASNKDYKKKLSISKAQSSAYLHTVASLNTQLNIVQSSVTQLQNDSQSTMEDHTRIIEHSQERIKKTTKQTRLLQSKLYRAKNRTRALAAAKVSGEKATKLADKGVYSPAARSLVRKIVMYGCPAAHAGKVLAAVMSYISPLVSNNGNNSRKKICAPSARTVARIIAEAGLAAKIQLGFDMLHAPG